MEFLLAEKDPEEILSLMRIVRLRGLEGVHGTWEEYLKVYSRKCGTEIYGTEMTSPSDRHIRDSVVFLTTLNKKEDLELLFAWLRSPSRALARLLACKWDPQKDTVEQKLVRMTLCHEDHPLHYIFSHAEDWVVTGIPRNGHLPGQDWVPSGIGRNKRFYFQLRLIKTEMISLCCVMVLCEDGSEAAVRVAALDRDLKVVLDEFVKPNQPIADYRTGITGLTAQVLENATTLSLSDLQEKLWMLLSVDTILVGHCVYKYLKALKVDHARVIDTSLLDISNPPIRPSLNSLCKSVLGYELQEGPGRCNHEAEAAMKLVLAVVDRGEKTFIPPPGMMLKTEKPRVSLGTKRSYPEEKNVMSPEKQSGANDVHEETFATLKKFLATGCKVDDKGNLYWPSSRPS